MSARRASLQAARDQVDPAIRQKWAQAFRQFDVSGNGVIEPSELEQVMMSMRMKPAAGEVQSMIAAVDHNNDGAVDFEEFELMMVADGRGDKGIGFANIVTRHIRMSDIAKLISQECTGFTDQFMRANINTYLELPSGDQSQFENQPIWHDVYKKFCAEAELKMQSVLVLWGVLSQQKFEEEFLESAMGTNIMDDFLKVTEYNQYINRMYSYVYAYKTGQLTDPGAVPAASRPETPHANNDLQRRLATLDRELEMLDMRRNELMAERRELIGCKVEPVTTQALKMELERIRWREDVGFD
jgi:hypothetical protein